MGARRLIVVDGYSLLFRAFFGTRYLSTADGKPTNALFGFIGMLFLMIEQQRPDALVVALDAPGPTFRHEEFEAYKGTRRETPNELRVQLAASRELIEALGLPSIEVSGFEADDVIGTLSRLAEENGYDTTIVTGDLDALQLVDDHVTVATNRVGMTDVVLYTPATVRTRFGIDPELIPDYKALVGDPSDNIPGVPGVGDKTASKLLSTYGPIERIMERIDEIDERVRKKIEPHLKHLPQYKRLATIHREVPLEYDFAPYRMSGDTFERAKALFESLEFRTHARRLSAVLGPYLEDGAAPVEQAPAARVATPTLEPVASLDELTDWIGDRRYGLFFGSPPAQASMFEQAEEDIAFVSDGEAVRQTPRAVAEGYFARHSATAVLHDAKPLYRRTPEAAAAPALDTRIAAFVLQSSRSAYALRDLVQGYLEVEPPTTPEGMAHALLPLADRMRERVVAESQDFVLDTIELPLIPVLAEMERWGIRVDTDFLVQYSAKLGAGIAEVQAHVFQQAGEEFAIASPKQLGDVLFEKMGLPQSKKTKIGYATGADVLDVLAPDYPIVSDILTWREISKLKSTYADALPKVVAEDGRIHTTFNQIGAATGRLSSIEPNLQNLPVRTQRGREIRRAFIADDGWRLVSFDYSQIELRLLAHFCRDENLVGAFERGEDVHRTTASLMFGVEASEVTSDMRGKAKLLNFAVLYGVTDFGLARQLGRGFPTSEARTLIEQYYERFPSIKAYMESVVAEARAKGFTTTLVGRRRYFPEIHTANRATRLYAERQALNAPMQGSAADLIKLAMIRVHELLRERKTRMLLQVHDELLFEMPAGEEDLVPEIRRLMETAVEIDVPMVVDVEAGLNWNEMQALPS